MRNLKLSILNSHEQDIRAYRQKNNLEANEGC